MGRKKLEFEYGKKYGMLTAINIVDAQYYTKKGTRKHGQVWHFKCDCGGTIDTLSYNVIKGSVKSCGCLKNKNTSPKYIDYTGKRFGSLVVIGRVSVGEYSNSNRSAKWLCKCACGKERITYSDTLKKGRLLSCGCTHPNTVDMTNQRFGKLICLKPLGPNSKGHMLWECLCDCGNTHVTAGTHLRRGATTSCGCIGKSGVHNPNWSGYEGISGSVWVNIYNGRRRKCRDNLEFTITKEYAWELFLKQEGKCALTGQLLSLDTSSRTASLDRIDSAKGYIEGNVQWVHSDINFMKRNFSQDYFIDLCRKVNDYNT